MTDEAIKCITVPAQPGFDVVELSGWPDELPYGFVYTPVVAWVVVGTVDPNQNVDAYVYPVCADPACNGTPEGRVFRYPNGDIVFLEGPTFTKGNEAEALAYEVKRSEKKDRRLI